MVLIKLTRAIKILIHDNAITLAAQIVTHTVAVNTFSVKNRMGIKAKLLLLVALMVGTVSVRAQKSTKPTTTQPPTETPT